MSGSLAGALFAWGLLAAAIFAAFSFGLFVHAVIVEVRKRRAARLRLAAQEEESAGAP